MRKIAFLDRDGTINIDKEYLYKIEDFEFIPGVIEGLKTLQDNDYLLVIITNQSGIARGYYSEDDLNVLHNWMLSVMKKEGINIDGIYYCPHLPTGKIESYSISCQCRKPNTKLFRDAITNLGKQYELDLRNSVAIGDKERDLSICIEIGARGILIGDKSEKEWIYSFENFKQATDWIVRRNLE